MNTYILGNSGFSRDIFEQLFIRKYISTFTGFIILNGDKPFVISNDGVKAFEYEDDSSFVLGVDTLEERIAYIEHFTQHYPVSTKFYPNFYVDSCHISHLSSLGVGNIFCHNSSIFGNSSLGNFNLLKAGSTISYNCDIGNYNILDHNAHVSSKCKILDYNYVSINATITENICIGSHNTISAGECLFDNLQDKELFQSGITQRKF